MLPPQDERWMRLALEEAQKALQADEVPIGAVVVSQGMLIGRGHNQPIATNDPTAHAEIIALREAATRMGNYRLPDASLYVTVEPCLMCVGAMVQARIKRLVYGAPDPKAGAISSTQDIDSMPGLNHRFAVTSGVMEHECRQLLQDFFQKKRGETQPAKA